eukprot:TRINITY_DN5388_c0_g1_i1.p1 TRINITY_DN5388_c0_g1~~TRINITY_DN5388_c0_g1_i1.p1  ORF type:complete len:337 (+),score=51.44 TRINITY_DN5388_c0_g1_i1:271-1281(+)
MNPQGHNPNKDHELNQPPNDSISSLSFSPKGNFLVAGSWDNQVRCWELQSGYGGVQSMPKAATSHDAPVLCTSWSGDGSRVYTGSCDMKAKCWSLQTGQATVVAQHQAPIKSVFWIDDMNLLQTGSWDKTLKYWDGRQANPTASIQLPERVYSADVRYPLSVVGLAERHIIIYDLRKPGAEFKRFPSPLKYQTRVVSCFPDKSGFAVGSIEGRVGIHYVEEKDSSKNFAFKCHRDNNEIFSVNVIAFHPGGTFATAGSDGAYNFWDKDSKQRLKPFTRSNMPISAGAFNFDGTLFAYSICYDWSKGVEYYNPAMQKNYILVHQTVDAEIKSRPTKR